MRRALGTHRPRSLLTAFTIGFVSLVIALWLLSLRAESVTADQTLPTQPVAESPTGQPTPARPDPFDGPGVGLDLLAKLAAVLGLAYISLALLKRYTYGNAGNQRGTALKVLESTSLAPNRAIYLVRAGDKQILLGVTPTQITALSEWATDESGSPASVPPPFRAHLSQLGK